MTDQTNDNVASIRARLAAVNPTNQQSTETIQPQADADDTPIMDNWDITLNNDEVLQVYGFFSFNPLGAVFASNRPDGSHVVECIVPWDSVRSMERIPNDEDAAGGDTDI